MTKKRDEMKIILLFLGLLLLNGCASSFLPNLTRASIEKEPKELPKNSIVMAEMEAQKNKDAELARVENANEKKLEQKKVNSIPQGTSHSIDLNWDTIPSSYINDNDSFDEIFSRLQGVAVKDKYETQKEFVSRTASLIDDTIYAFSVLANSSYDAEKKLWEIYLKEKSSYVPSLSNRGVIISDNLEDRGSYVGANSFGLVMDVFQEHLTVKMLECYPSLARSIPNPSLTLSMDSNSARHLGEKSIGVLLISKIIKLSPTSTIKQEVEPTIGARVHIISVTYKLGIELYQIWIYDKKTGKVFAKQFVHD